MWISVTNIYLFIFHKRKSTIIITSSGAFQTKPGPSTEGTAAHQGVMAYWETWGEAHELGFATALLSFFHGFLFYRFPMAIFIISISVGVRRFLSNHGVQRTTTGPIPALRFYPSTFFTERSCRELIIARMQRVEASTSSARKCDDEGMESDGFHAPWR